MRHQVRGPPWEPLLGSSTGREEQGQGPRGKRDRPGCNRVGPWDSSNPMGKGLLSQKERRVWMKMVSRAEFQAPISSVSQRISKNQCHGLERLAISEGWWSLVTRSLRRAGERGQEREVGSVLVTGTKGQLFVSRRD